MKLLFDQNLSHRLVQALREEYPPSQHVREVGLSEASDDAVWQYAAQHGFTLITKDADFHQRSSYSATHRKWCGFGVANCSTSSIEHLLQIHHAHLLEFAHNPEGAFFALQ